MNNEDKLCILKGMLNTNDNIYKAELRANKVGKPGPAV